MAAVHRDGHRHLGTRTARDRAEVAAEATRRGPCPLLYLPGEFDSPPHTRQTGLKWGSLKTPHSVALPLATDRLMPMMPYAWHRMPWIDAVI